MRNCEYAMLDEDREWLGEDALTVERDLRTMWSFKSLIRSSRHYTFCHKALGHVKATIQRRNTQPDRGTCRAKPDKRSRTEEISIHFLLHFSFVEGNSTFTPSLTHYQKRLTTLRTSPT